MKKLWFIFFLFLTLSNAYGMDITLEWTSNPDADYYIVYYGTGSGDYINQTEKIPNTETEHTITDLEDLTYYLAVKAFNSCGNSSDFSEEVSNGALPGVVESVTVKTCVTYEAQ